MIAIRLEDGLKQQRNQPIAFEYLTIIGAPSGRAASDTADSLMLMKRQEAVSTPTASTSTDTGTSKSRSSPSALQIDHPSLSVCWPENTSKALLKQMEWPEFKWRLAGTSWLTEAFYYKAFTEDGALLFLQVAYSNVAWPNNTCSVFVKYYRPTDGLTMSWQETVTALRMKCSADNMSVSVKDTAIEYKPPGDDGLPTYLLSHENEAFKLVLEFQPTEKPMQIDNGETRYGAKGSDGYILFQFIPCGTVTGYLQTKSSTGAAEESVPIAGRGISIHQYQGVRPNVASTRFDVVYFSQATNTDPADRDTDLFMVQFRTPPGYGNFNINIGFMTCRGQLTALSTGNAVMVGEPVKDPESGYQLPTAMEMTWSGRNLDGQCFEASAQLKPTNCIAKINVLERVPFFVRKAVEMLVAKPHIFMWCDRAQFQLAVNEGQSRQLEGSVYYEIDFINPVAEEQL